VLSLPLSSTEQTAADRERVIRQSAERMLRAWWEAKTPRPTQNYVGARKVLERLLDAGWSEAQLVRALPSVPIISAKACELALRQAQPPGPAVIREMDDDRSLGEGEWILDGEGQWQLQVPT
jgi:hypothetical protein